MIERLLAADDALGRGELDLAERLFGQVAEADARNAIAVVGLGQIAMRRGDVEAARAALLRALEIDPDEAAAQRLLVELESETPPDVTSELATAGGAAHPEPVPAPEPAATPAAPEPPLAPVRRPSLLDRIRRWLGLSGDRG